jgi:uncharacterized RDD family membrane protein YckC
LSNILIDTPENLTLEAQVAGFGSRCLAAVVDYLLLGIVLVIAGIFSVRAVNNAGLAGSTALALFILLQFALFTFYHLAFEFLLNGQTPGKRLLGMRVVQASGMPATTTGLLVRNLVRLFDFFPVFYGVGLVVMFFSQRTQRFGDIAARTIVVYEKRQLTLNDLRQDARVRYHYIQSDAPVPDFINVSLLSDRDRRTITSYLQRRGELHTHQPGLMLATYLARKMQITPNDLRLSHRIDIDQFLEKVARAFER